MLLASVLWSPSCASLVDRHAIVFGLRNFFWWFVFIDVAAVAVLYKIRYGRTIVHELGDKETTTTTTTTTATNDEEDTALDESKKEA